MRFDQGAFEWSRGKTSTTGTYACDGWVVHGSSTMKPPSVCCEGEIDSDTGILLWEDEEYGRVE